MNPLTLELISVVIGHSHCGRYLFFFHEKLPVAAARMTGKVKSKLEYGNAKEKTPAMNHLNGILNLLNDS